MKDNILLEKSLKFSAQIVNLNKYLTKEKREGIISKQIIRSATSIGANANEAVYGIRILIKRLLGNKENINFNIKYFQKEL